MRPFSNKNSGETLVSDELVLDKIKRVGQKSVIVRIRFRRPTLRTVE